MANLGIGRWANQTFNYWSWFQSPIIYDDLLPYYTNYTRMFSYTNYNSTDKNSIISIKQDFGSNKILSYTFLFCQMPGTLKLSSAINPKLDWTFDECKFKCITFKDDVEPWKPITFEQVFRNCPNLEEIGPFDLSNVNSSYGSECFKSSKLKSIHCTHFKLSFSISSSTAFEEADLVEIISNLDTVTTTQTLTMGATNLAKLTDDEKQVATDKGWVLA